MIDALHFQSVRVRRLPGFPSGGPSLEELSPGINLVAGPNASGKTSTAKVLQTLLWPGEGDDAVSAFGHFGIREESWVVDVDGRRSQWQRNGNPSAAPPLPPAETRGRYFLSLHELLREDDRDLADRIRIESAGGYDVPTAAAALGFSSGGRPRNLMDTLKSAREALAEAKDEAARLREQRSKLEDLRSRLEKLEESAAGIRALERALELVRARQALAEAQEHFDTFPTSLEQFRGDEVERLSTWRDKEQQYRDAEADAIRAQKDAERHLEELGLGNEGVPRSLVHETEKRLQKIREAEDHVSALRKSIAGARGRGMGTPTDAEGASPVDEETLERIDAFLRRVSEARARRSELNTRKKVLEAQAGAALEDADKHREAVRLLREWLRASSGDPSAADRRNQLISIAAIALIVIGATALILGLVGAGPVLSGIVPGVLSIIIGAVVLLRRPPAPQDPREELAQEIRRTGVTPNAWDTEAVRSKLQELEQLLAREDLADERRTELSRLRAELTEADEAWTKTQDERLALAAELGLEAEAGDLALAVVGTRVIARDAAKREEHGAREELAEIEKQLSELLEVATTPLAAFGYQPADGTALSEALDDLRERRELHQQRTRELADARRRHEDAQREIRDIQEARESLFTRVGIEGADREVKLREFAGQVDAYRSARTELDTKSRLHRIAESALTELADRGDATATLLLEETVDTPDIEALEGRRQTAEAASAEAKDIREQIVRIDQSLRAAREKHDVEAALAREAAALKALEDRRSEDVEAAIGGALAQWLRADEEDHNRPAVFHRAKELLVTITRGRYKLLMGTGDSADFRALDTRDGHGRSLDELSAGTRLQLLLAVRIAFVETQESGVALPLLLDEVLANSDDPRAHAIIDAAIELARSGRQVFYFTAQADELARWKQRLDGDDVPWVERRLESDDGVDAGFEWISDTADFVAPPAPGNMSRDAYGRALGVGPLDVWRPGIGHLHLWHVVEDLETLHQLLDAGVTTSGELEMFATSAGSRAPEAVRRGWEIARPRAEICRRFTELYRRGRDRPLDRAVLVDSGAVSDTFIDDVTDLASEYDGRGSDLVVALQNNGVPRFQTRMIEKLESYLREEGYIASEEPLAEDELLLRLTAESHAIGNGLTRMEVQALVVDLSQGPTGVWEASG